LKDSTDMRARILLYERTIVPIQTNEGMHWAWTYLYAMEVDENSRIESGRWRLR
jgi:gamma-glutamylcyclotransferase (GGCT)/AIG2-like uncharacterized protein YtfP